MQAALVDAGIFVASRKGQEPRKDARLVSMGRLGNRPPIDYVRLPRERRFVAGCNCALSGSRVGAGCEARAPYWMRRGVVRQGAVLREETYINS